MVLQYRTYPPSEFSRHLVRYYWFLEGPGPYTHHALAGPCAELLFHYQGRFDERLSQGVSEPSFISGVSAPTTQPRTFVSADSFSLFGAYLYPQAIPLLFGLPADALSDQMVDLPTLDPEAGPELEDQVMNSPGDHLKIEKVELFIRDRLGRAPAAIPLLSALRTWVGLAETPRVRTLSFQMALSERQLERQFRQYAGFPPRTFFRLQRFQYTLRKMGNPRQRLTELAFEGGYADQSHFIREFKAFAGVSPGSFLRNQAQVAGLWLGEEP